MDSVAHHVQPPSLPCLANLDALSTIDIQLVHKRVNIVFGIVHIKNGGFHDHKTNANLP